MTWQYNTSPNREPGSYGAYFDEAKEFSYLHWYTKTMSYGLMWHNTLKYSQIFMQSILRVRLKKFCAFFVRFFTTLIPFVNLQPFVSGTTSWLLTRMLFTKQRGIRGMTSRGNWILYPSPPLYPAQLLIAESGQKGKKLFVTLMTFRVCLT